MEAGGGGVISSTASNMRVGCKRLTYMSVTVAESGGGGGVVAGYTIHSGMHDTRLTASSRLTG